MSKKIAIILKGYPRLSETFIAQEILALQQRGLDIQIISLRHPTDHSRHPIHEEITAPVNYLPEYLHQEPLRVLNAWWKQRRRPGYRNAVKAFLKDLDRDRTRNRARRFGQALVLANELPPGTEQLYVHFLHTPASVAYYAAQIVELPWSASAHAKDIWISPEWEKREKLNACSWLVTCTKFNYDHLSSLAPDPSRVALVYHGLDFQRFPPPEEQRPPRDGRDSEDPVQLLSVGRAVPKKGYDTLLQALATLPPDLHWRFTHIGGGETLTTLKQLASRLGLDNRIAWLGAQPQQEVLQAYRRADLFVLSSRVTEDGDRDGLPNVLMEAQSQELACLSTHISGIPELISDGETGLLVAPDDVDALSQALVHLVTDPARRLRIGASGGRRVRERFSLERGIERLCAQFDHTPCVASSTHSKTWDAAKS